MNRLRTLALLTLVAGLFAGLTGCANRKGDLGADLDAPPVLVDASPDSAETVPLGSGIAVASNSKNSLPQSVSIDRVDKLAVALEAATPTIRKGEAPKPVGDSKDEKKPDPLPKAENETPKPVEVNAEVTPVATIPVAPDTNPGKDAAENAKSAVRDAIARAEKTARVEKTERLKAAEEQLKKLESEAPKSVASTPVSNANVEVPVVAANVNVPPALAKSALPAAPLAPASLIADDDNKPKPPPPANETPEERAARLIRELKPDIKTQATLQEAEAAYQTGLRAFNEWEYEKAKTYFEKAVLLDPAHQDANAKLRVTRSLLNIDVAPFSKRIRDLEDRARVEMQEQTIILAHTLEEARAFEVRGSESALETDPTQKTRSLNERLGYLEQAQSRYRRAREVIDWMPASFDLPAQRKQAEEALNRVRGKIEKLNEEIAYVARAEAHRLADDRKTRESEQYKLRIAKLLEQVKAMYDIQDYKGAEMMSVRVLMIDPMNVQAESWKKKARAAAHKHESELFRSMSKEETRRIWEDVDEAIIANDDLIKYPATWDQIQMRRTETTFGRKVAEDTWKTEMRKKLQRKVSFEFVDTPLADAVEFLRHFANATMIIDPKVLAASPPVINLRVTDMNLDLALEWILKLAELEYAFQDNAIFISKAQNLLASVEMKIYDVSDLTQTIQDFPGPEFQITVAGDKAGGGGGAGNPFIQKAPTSQPTNQTIADMIRNRVRPETWDAAQGTSIEERGGRLVVMQRPEIHKLIDQLLSNFRATQKMMINIESRFLNIREAYLEQTGVEFQGLDPNVLFGDFGDLRRLGAPTGFIQPRVPGSTDTSPPNLPFPGFVNGPDRMNGGTFSQVGSIINHSINFFTNDPDSISAQDANNIVRQGGLSAQVTVLNNTQVQAFIRALAVRENSSTLIAPRLTVFNTQRANMFVARQQSYVADYEISGDSYDPVIRQFLVGVVLDVKPIVSSDRRYVTLELRPTVTELVNFVTRQIDTFSVNSGAQVNVLVLLSFPIQFPELSIRRVRTTATVPDGGIMVVGGLYKNLKFNAENGVPFLSDLPVVGRLFRWNVVDNAKSNLAILVSPRIIMFNEEEEKLLR